MVTAAIATGGAAGTLSLGEVMRIRDEARAVMAQERIRNGQSLLSSPAAAVESPRAAVGAAGAGWKNAAGAAAAAINLAESDDESADTACRPTR